MPRLPLPRHPSPCYSCKLFKIRLRLIVFNLRPVRNHSMCKSHRLNWIVPRQIYNLPNRNQSAPPSPLLFDGAILSISASVGDSVGTTKFITIADLSQPYLEVLLDETDLNNVGIGYDVSVTFDALPNQTFTGKLYPSIHR